MIRHSDPRSSAPSTAPSRPNEGARITAVKPMLSPALLIDELPVPDDVAALVQQSRRAIGDIIAGRDSRLLVVVGPCSVHDTEATFEYASRLHERTRTFQDDLVVVLRSYFEKPRTTLGWKGLVNDPDLDGSFYVNKGLRLARRLLLRVNGLGLPTATEFLDTQIPQYFDDLTAWAAIGARTTESQVHRELASGLSMPVGFKNSTDGNVQPAIDAVVAAGSEHWFPGVTKQGLSAFFHTTGNDTCHVILRGGASGPNYDGDHVGEVCRRLQANGCRPSLMIDCSHGNSLKVFGRQIEVAESVAQQVERGSQGIFGVMIESHLVEGRQDLSAGRSLTYGQSITDGCLSLDATIPVLERLAAARRARHGARG